MHKYDDALAETDSDWEGVRQERQDLLSSRRADISTTNKRTKSYYLNLNVRCWLARLICECDPDFLVAVLTAPRAFCAWQAYIDMVRVLEDKPGSGSGDEAKHNRAVKWAVYISFACNVFLLLIKLVAAVSSRSLSVIASAVDSVLDLLSGLIMFFTERAILKRDPYKYPVGRRRLEPLGIIVFASVMGTAALQLVTTAVEAIIQRKASLSLAPLTLVILIAVIAIKLALFLWCRIVGRKSSMVEALATDHITDVLTNSVGTGCALVAFYQRKLVWFDGVGALLLAFWILRTWASKGYQQLILMSGRAAPASFVQLITHMAYNHSKYATVDTVRAYHVGTTCIVEVDIMLPRDMPLQVAHDIGEKLQFKIEALDEVERAYVHLDYETDHNPTTEHKLR